MTLRHKDDWDEALEEARIRSGELPVKLFVPPVYYDYGISYVISYKELGIEWLT